MSRPSRAALLLMLALGACGDDDDGQGGTDASAVETPAGETTAVETTVVEATDTEAPVESTTTAAVAGTTVMIEVADGRVVSGGGRVDVAIGDSVSIVVTSDAADEVHVHGYDVFADTVAEGSVTIEFPADIPGVFEVELEESKLVLVELEVK